MGIFVIAIAISLIALAWSAGYFKKAFERKVSLKESYGSEKEASSAAAVWNGQNRQMTGLFAYAKYDESIQRWVVVFVSDND